VQCVIPAWTLTALPSSFFPPSRFLHYFLDLPFVEVLGFAFPLPPVFLAIHSGRRLGSRACFAFPAHATPQSELKRKPWSAFLFSLFPIFARRRICRRRMEDSVPTALTFSSLPIVLVDTVSLWYLPVLPLVRSRIRQSDPKSGRLAPDPAFPFFRFFLRLVDRIFD